MNKQKCFHVWKSILATALVFVTLTTMFTGCSSPKHNITAIATKDGELLKYNVADIGGPSSAAPHNGYYIMHGNTIFPILKYGMLEPTGIKLQWFTEKYEKLVPSFKSGDHFIYISSVDSPDKNDLQFCRLKDKGYTLGTIFSTIKSDTSNKDVVSFASDNAYYCSSSPIKNICTRITDNAQGTIQITDINKKTFTPDILNHGLLTPAQKNGKYTLGYYIGTQYFTVSLFADTHLFKAVKKNYPVNSYRKTKSGYFIIDIPKEMKNGYYWLGTLGMFKYDAGEDETVSYEDDYSSETGNYRQGNGN